MLALVTAMKSERKKEIAFKTDNNHCALEPK